MENMFSASSITRNIFRSAAIFIVFVCSACASLGKPQWAAHGYLTPGPTSNPEIIGLYDNERDCRAAADAWMGRQVVGNPIFAECYPIDRN